MTILLCTIALGVVLEIAHQLHERLCRSDTAGRVLFALKQTKPDLGRRWRC